MNKISLFVTITLLTITGYHPALTNETKAAGTLPIITSVVKKAIELPQQDIVKMQAPHSSDEKGLKDYFSKFFFVGVAVSPQSLKTDEAPLILKEFNSITPENAMKMGPIHPNENEYYWKDADSIAAFANEMASGYAVIIYAGTTRRRVGFLKMKPEITYQRKCYCND